ncbi:Flp pilus assembly protein CpaB [Candidatus Sumerlaeota bacterium]|nr:Flp pilus assembly protein CpaB [Candidatus Sumerlaeota bacterium]
MKDKIPLIIAIVFGLIAAAMIMSYLQSHKAKPPQTVSVMTARVSISQGELLEERHVEWTKIDQNSYIRESMITQSERSGYMKRNIRRDIAKGDLILKGDLYFEETFVPDITPLIQKGMRAISIPINATSAVSFLVKPGDLVDVLINYEIPYIRETEVEVPNTGKFKVGQKETEPATLYLLQNVQVLSVDRVILSDQRYKDETNQGYRAVTIAVTPQEARMLAFANKNTDDGYTLVLRNREDDGILEDLEVASYKSVLEEAKLKELLETRRDFRAFEMKGGEIQ